MAVQLGATLLLQVVLQVQTVSSSVERAPRLRRHVVLSGGVHVLTSPPWAHVPAAGPYGLSTHMESVGSVVTEFYVFKSIKRFLVKTKKIKLCRVWMSFQCSSHVPCKSGSKRSTIVERSRRNRGE